MTRDEAIIGAKLLAGILQDSQDVWQYTGDARHPPQDRYIVRSPSKDPPQGSVWMKYAEVEVDGTVRGLNYQVSDMLSVAAESASLSQRRATVEPSALLTAAQVALAEMRQTGAPRQSFTDAVDALAAAIAGALHG